MDEFFSGNYVQFAVPPDPPLLFGKSVLNRANAPNVLEAQFNSTVEVLWYKPNKATHPIHIHGQKFAVLEQGFTDTGDCDIDFCVSGLPVPRNWAGSNTALKTLIYKDTLAVSPGGWIRFRFIANNPGWWLAHCHNHYHQIDGTALVIHEPGPNNVLVLPPLPVDFPSNSSSIPPSEPCNCFQMDDRVQHLYPSRSYTCSKSYLCYHTNPALIAGPICSN